MRILTVGLVVLVLGAAYLCTAVVVTRLSTPGVGHIPILQGSRLPPANGSLRVLTWNLGYAGLGSAATFVADGGKDFVPDSWETVAHNVNGIRGVLSEDDADVMLLQEMTSGSVLNRWMDVLSEVGDALPSAAKASAFDVSTALLPPPLRVQHGKAVFAEVAMAEADRHALPLEDGFVLGVLRHNYSALISRYPIDGTNHAWVIMNVHLAAFDDGEIRRAQLQEALRIAEAAHSAGDPVIIGGDFNLEFVRDAFPSTEASDHRFWLRDFPFDMLPPGWRAAHPTNAPTARTLADSFIQGSTYTTVIDGFIVSPNVAVESVETNDMDFAFSDHQPVIGRFRFIDH